MILTLVSTLVSLSLTHSFAQIPEPLILQKDGVTSVTLESSLSQVRPGQIVLIGEEHYSLVHQNYQMRVLQQLRMQGLRVSVGMEFFEYPHQPHVDAFQLGMMNESDFLKSIRWSGDFNFYRDQVMFPVSENSKTLALNLPRAISGQIAKGGLASLTPEQAAKLPPRLERGNQAYFRRFLKAVGGHLPTKEAEENYFMAQSAWDETMAWKASQFLTSHPDQVLVILVGEFHVQYGGGLPDRLQVWGVPKQNILTHSLVNLAGLSAEEKKAAVLPSTEDGPRADFLWISEF